MYDLMSKKVVLFDDGSRGLSIVLHTRTFKEKNKYRKTLTINIAKYPSRYY